MRFEPTAIPGLVLIHPQPQEDERGLLARTFCQSEFAEHALPSGFAQCSVVFTRRRGTLRGMHWQCAPALEGKLVRCTQGAIYDVALDLRPDSATYLQWAGFELTQHNRLQLYVPEGCAHGVQTLIDECEVHYSITAAYRPELQRGVRWDDPTFGIAWPVLPPVVSARDAAFPDWRAERAQPSTP